jgi:transcription elongation factor Elf1
MDRNLIVCIFCGKKADIVKQDESVMVACSHCDRETELDEYQELFDQWIDEIRKEIHER